MNTCMFRIILVMDIFNGVVVHAVKGERASYKPIVSKVCSSSSPRDMISIISPKEVYIADLNRLQGMGNNFKIIESISLKVKTMIDIGAENMKDVEMGLTIADNLVLGTETASLQLIEKATEEFSEKIVISIDLKDGVVLTKDKSLRLEPEKLVRLLDGYDINEIIILNLSKVGTGYGIDAEFLEKIVSLSSHNILFGGGVRDMRDIHALKEIGIGGALVATAVHNGNIPLEALRCLDDHKKL